MEAQPEENPPVRTLEAYAPPSAAPIGASGRVVVAVDGKFPRICVHCGAREGVRRHAHTFVWFPKVILFAAVLGILPVFLLYRFFRRVVGLRLPECEPCRTRASGAQTRTNIASVACALLLVVAIGVASSGAPLAGLAGAAGVIVMFVGLSRRWQRQMVRAVYIAPTTVTLSGVCEAAAGGIEGTRARSFPAGS
ncbi:MAG TPA: hypothetical protein VHS09_15925, partial [Polyangiaceae bacterium]|nr:hypothetical protein [Polyangiaceae bacterium]